jgi:hypothetical protein
LNGTTVAQRARDQAPAEEFAGCATQRAANDAKERRPCVALARRAWNLLDLPHR